MQVKKASTENLTPSKMNSSHNIYEREKNHFFDFSKKKQPLIDKISKKNLQKRLKPFGIDYKESSFIVSKKKLYFFQLAAFFQENGKSWIQIHPGALKNSFVTKRYPLDEILAHEIVHFARKNLNDDSFFEEWIAYRTSTSYRKYVGCHIGQILFCALLLNASVILNIFFTLPILFVFPLVPIFIVFFRERIVWRAKKILGRRYLSVLCRLTWKQIKRLARTKDKKAFFLNLEDRL